jgi:hypothetical protein
VTNGVSPAGIYNWNIDGTDQLYHQWFYYRVGGVGPESAIQSISGSPVINEFVNIPSLSKLDLTYSGNQFSVRTVYQLIGQNNGTGRANFNQTIVINNTSAATLDFHFFQYSDFDLGAAAGVQSVQFFQNDFGQYYRSEQAGGGRTLIETVSPASHVEASIFPTTLSSLQDGATTILNDNATAGIGDVTFAYQWDLTLAPGSSFVISKLMGVVPEPSSFALISSGIVALALLRRRSRGATESFRNAQPLINKTAKLENHEAAKNFLTDSKARTWCRAFHLRRRAVCVRPNVFGNRRFLV